MGGIPWACLFPVVVLMAEEAAIFRAIAGAGAVDRFAPRRPIDPQHCRGQRLVLDPHIARAAELEVPQPEALLPVVERLEVEGRFKILAVVEWP